MKFRLPTIVFVFLYWLQLPVQGQEESPPLVQEEARSGQDRRISLTLERGKHVVDIHRLYPDKVVVTKEGGWQFTFKREEILDAENEEVTRILAEAERPLAEVGNQDLEAFPALLTQLDRYRSEVEQLSHIYDWLIPEASQSLSLLSDAKDSVETTLSTVRRTDRILESVRQSVRENQPLSEGWGEVYKTALEEIEKIPFERIGRDLSARIEKERDRIASDLLKRKQTLTNRLEESGAELRRGIAEGSLTRGQRATLLRQMWRTAKELPEAESRNSAIQFVENLEKETEGEADLPDPTKLPTTEPLEATATPPVKAATSGEPLILPSSPTLAAPTEATVSPRMPTITQAASVDLRPPPEKEPLARPPEAPSADGIDVRVVGGAIAALLLIALYFLLRPKERLASKPSKGAKRVFARAQPTPAPEEPIQEGDVAEPATDETDSSPSAPPSPVVTGEPDKAPSPEQEHVEPVETEPPPAPEAEPQIEVQAFDEDTSVEDQAAISLDDVLESASLGAETDIPAPQSEPLQEPDVDTDQEDVEEPGPLPPSQLDTISPVDTDIEEPPPISAADETEPSTGGESVEELASPPTPGIELEHYIPSNRAGEFTPYDVYTCEGVEMELGEGISFKNTRPVAFFPLGDRLGCVSRSWGETEIRLVQRQESGDLEIHSIPSRRESCISLFHRSGGFWLLHESGISVHVPSESGVLQVASTDAGGPSLSNLESIAYGIPSGRYPLWGSEGTLIAAWPGGNIGGFQVQGESHEIRMEEIWSFDERSASGFSPPASNLTTVANIAGFISQGGALHLLDPATGEELQTIPLPHVWIPDGWPAGLASSENSAFFLKKEMTGEMLLCALDVPSGGQAEEVPVTPCLHPSVFNIGNTLLLLSENEIALFEIDRLARVWSISLEEEQPLDFSWEGSQIAVLVRDGGGKTEVKVLGKNSGAELWSLEAEECGMTQIASSIIHDGRLLLWGEGPGGQGILRLVD